MQAKIKSNHLETLRKMQATAPQAKLTSGRLDDSRAAADSRATKTRKWVVNMILFVTMMNNMNQIMAHHSSTAEGCQNNNYTTTLVGYINNNNKHQQQTKVSSGGSGIIISSSRDALVSCGVSLLSRRRRFRRVFLQHSNLLLDGHSNVHMSIWEQRQEWKQTKKKHNQKINLSCTQRERQRLRFYLSAEESFSSSQLIDLVQ